MNFFILNIMPKEAIFLLSILDWNDSHSNVFKHLLVAFNLMVEDTRLALPKSASQPLGTTCALSGGAG